MISSLPLTFLPLAGLICLLTSCQGEEPVPKADGARGPLSVFTVNEPLRFFAQRIGGDLVEARFPMAVDGDPAHWKPGADQIQAYQGADLVIRNGAGYAGWLDRVSMPLARIVDASEAIEDRLIVLADSVTHQHGPTGSHSHSGHAFTIWLDPLLAAEQAASILRALITRLPGHRADLQARYDSLNKELQGLDASIATFVSAQPKRPLLASHPVYQYLQARFGLSLRSLHWEPDAMPSEEEWARLTSLLEAQPAKAMLWEGEPLPAVRKRLEGLGIACLVYDPCSRTPSKGDFLDVMRTNVENLSKAWR